MSLTHAIFIARKTIQQNFRIVQSCTVEVVYLRGVGNLQILHYKKEYEIKNPQNFVCFTSKGIWHTVGGTCIKRLLTFT